MAIVVDMGGGQSPFEGALQGGLQGAAGFAKGYQQAVDQTEEREELRRQRDRDAERHGLEMEEAAKALEILGEEQTRSTERFGFETGRLEDEDRDRDRAFKRGKKEDRQGDRRFKVEQQQKRVDLRVDKQQLRDSRREFTWNKENRDRAATERAKAETKAATILATAAAGDERDATAFLRNLKRERLSQYFDQSDWDAITNALSGSGKPTQDSISEARREVQAAVNKAQQTLDEAAVGSVRQGELGVVVHDAATGSYNFDELVGEGVLTPDQAQQYATSLENWDKGTRYEGDLNPSQIASQIRSRRNGMARRDIELKHRGASVVELEQIKDELTATLLAGADASYTLSQFIEDQGLEDEFEDLNEALAELSNPSSTQSTDELIAEFQTAVRAITSNGLTATQREDIAELKAERDDLLRELSESRAASARQQVDPGIPTQAAPFGRRSGGQPKGEGWKGEIPMEDGSGQVMTEMSTSVSFTYGDPPQTYDGDIPLIVPTLTNPEIKHLAEGNDPTVAIVEKARNHAASQLEQGKSPYKDGPPASPSSSTAATSGVRAMPSPKAAAVKLSKTFAKANAMVPRATGGVTGPWAAHSKFTPDELMYMEFNGGPGSERNRSEAYSDAQNWSDAGMSRDEKLAGMRKILELAGVNTSKLDASSVSKLFTRLHLSGPDGLPDDYVSIRGGHSGSVPFH